ncbi:MAG: hypothetical protein ABIX46_00365 [Burkholderiaceae bacterium]
MTVSDRAGAAGWCALCALLAACAMLGWSRDRAALDWQPALAASQPWRAWSAVAVHYSALHLAANLAGALLVGALGWTARVTPMAVLAWAIAWPFTHAALAVEPALVHYGGLSGVLHAGVAVVALHLAVVGRGSARVIGGALLAGLAVKLLSEAPWAGPLRHPPGWDIAVAPLAHATGVAAGLIAELAVLGLGRRARTAA